MRTWPIPSLRACLLALSCWCGAGIASPVYPQQDAASTRSLNGAWSFKYVAGAHAGTDEGFSAPAFNVTAWASIPVPANWEVKGFAEPAYADDLKEGLGLYRRTFKVPANWRGKGVFMRFEGVAFGYELWVNGAKAGASSASAFNPHTFDITEAIAANPGTEHVVALRVTTRPHGVEFDLNDDWSLSGIYRDVNVFTVPQLHLSDLTTATTLDADGAAQFAVGATLGAANGQVRATLVAPGGATVGRTLLRAGQDGRHHAVITVRRPALWTAETPSLYRLRLEVLDGGKVVQRVEERVGLRQVSIANGVLLLNGRPIKLRGVNHHDLDPLHGRAITEAQMRTDLLLMKKGNVNYVRTSHYAPDRRLLALCDELGLYVMDEVAIGHGEANLEKPDYRANILARVEATVLRDKNHASVLIWSIGNENPITEAELEAGRLAKKLDPSRPITIPKVGSYFARNHERIPEYVDIHAPHYPINKTLAAYAGTLKRPTILTEYAHALGLATDRIQDQWDILQASPTFAGGSIWHFMDQAILRTSAQPVDVRQPTHVVWLDQHRYLDTYGVAGADGLVYGDRTPQTDFWQMRKVYAPVQISEGSVAGGVARLEVENRHDFRALTGMTLHWTMKKNGKALQNGKLALRAAAREREVLTIAFKPPGQARDDVVVLELRCIDEQGLQINERTVRVGAPVSAADLLGSATQTPQLSESGAEVRIDTPQWSLHVQRSSGEVRIADRAGKLLVAGIYPHIGRKQTMAEALSAPKRVLWSGSLLNRLESPVIDVRPSARGVVIAVSGRYRHDDWPGQVLDGGYRLSIGTSGAIELEYDFALPADAVLSEAGLSLLAPAGLSEFRWIGQGPYAGYPGKDRLTELGMYHLSRADLHFQGNRRGTELAMLTAASGEGVALALAPGDVAVERLLEQTLLSHNALIGGLGNKGTVPEQTLELRAGARITGAFTMLPLSAQWPGRLTALFGKARPARHVFAPFYHSYDQ